MGLFGGDTDTSQSSSDGIAAINSSGWVIGKGNANGGSLSTQSGGLGLPWYGWVSLGIIAVVAIRRMKRKT